MVWTVGNCKVHSVCRTVTNVANYNDADDHDRALVNRHGAVDLAAYITSDCSEVYEDAFIELAKSRNGNFQPTLILIKFLECGTLCSGAAMADAMGHNTGGNLDT